MKKGFLFLLFFSPCILYAQKQGRPLIDSLLNEIGKSKQDSNMVKMLIVVSFNYFPISTDEGIKYGKQALQLATKLGRKKSMASAYSCIAINYDNKPDNDSALEYYYKALKIHEEFNNKVGIGQMTHYIGGVYKIKNDYPKALEYYLKALNIYENGGNKNNIAILSGDIGSLYNILGDPTKALEYELKGLKIDEEIGDKRNISADMSNIGNVYRAQQNYSEALVYYLKALKIQEDLGLNGLAANTLENMGTVYANQKKYADAIQYYNKAIKTAQETGNKYLTAAQLDDVGGIYLSIVEDTAATAAAIGERPAELLRKSIDYLEQSLKISKEINARNVMQACYEKLTRAYKLKNNYKGAYENFNAYIALKDSIFSTDNKVKIAGLETKREAELKEKQIEINRIQEADKKKERTLYIVGFGLLGIIIILIFRNNTTQRQTSARLGVANKQLEEEKVRSDELVHRQGQLLQQKDILMKEIHHRVKNNLQVISTLLDLQLATVNDEGAKDAMTESTTRVRSISLIHQQLYQNEDLTTIEFAKFARDLHFQVNTVFRQAGKKIELQNNIPEVLLDIDTAVPLGLILNELMTNSYKYAFAGDDPGTIKIYIGRNGSHYELIYEDSGPGLPQGFNADTSKSLGIRVMRSLSKQLGGKFVYDYEKKIFLITFKDLEGRKMED